ncbi:ATP-binding cassette domain-containing protein [Oceanospirillum sanctuarii]|uniref:ATP-binding cassette domain-containing protein n=1 Tax=Oceanospirillum sanctuarii TaxID=1434821 RepID=UPI000A3CAC51|nr:ATP-binding cassette domain-containing protein [Oceanospirillum sanctuarii]
MPDLKQPNTQHNVQTALITHQLTYQLPNGDRPFPELNLTLSDGITGLVGRNGCGKTLLAQLLAGTVEPSNGHIDYCGLTPEQIGYFSQLDEFESAGDTILSIADYLGLSEKLEALAAIEQGSSDAHWFECLGDDWLIREQLNEQLLELNLPLNPEYPVSQLSGGQHTRLRLWRLFRQMDSYRLLILDEPTNHLDQQGREWLINQIRAFQGSVLLISHDFTLLNKVDRIWELDSRGITEYGGNLIFYQQEKAQQSAALQRQKADLDKSIRKQNAEHQRNLEKAQQKAAQGKRLRKSGSQSKLLLDAKKEKAGGHLKPLNRRQAIHEERLNSHKESLREKLAEEIDIQICLDGNGSGAASQSRKSIARLISYHLPRGSSQPINLQLFSTDRWYLMGSNGSGKSTLFRLLAGQLPEQTINSSEQNPSNSKVQEQSFSSRRECFLYLDQHFNLLSSRGNLIETLRNASPELTESEARTLLAGIGFRRDKVFQSTESLSGGEKMRLALLLLAQTNQTRDERPFLLLDEPDNHLDLNAKHLLAEALKSYSGGFGLISHDVAFAQACGITSEFELVDETKLIKP